MHSIHEEQLLGLISTLAGSALSGRGRGVTGHVSAGSVPHKCVPVSRDSEAAYVTPTP